MAENPVFRGVSWLAWSSWGLAMALMAFTVAFTTLYPLSRHPASNAFNYAIALLFVASFSTVGALISSRRPRNPVGWVFCAMSLTLVVAIFAGNYAEYSLVVEPGALPGARTAAWVGNWIWLVALSPLGFFMLLFPDGRPPSRRWWVVAWVQAAALAVWTVSHALVPGPMVNAGYETIDNPYGVEALGSVLRVSGAASGLLLLAAVLASAVSLIVRFRRSQGDERRQLKWVAYAGALVILVLIVQLGIEAALPETSTLVEILNLTFVMSLTSVPIAAGIAILKHRLYDIDVIINRTLVYGALTVMLALVYVGSVAALQYVFRALVGGDSNVAVVGSTLVIAALFNPLRRHIQAVIDRRFYRRKYDARRTLEGFGARLREQTSLEALNENLVGVVRETMQPEHVSLWMPVCPRSEGARR